MKVDIFIARELFVLFAQRSGLSIGLGRSLLRSFFPGKKKMIELFLVSLRPTLFAGVDVSFGPNFGKVSHFSAQRETI
jgi:hypothetical protein